MIIIIVIILLFFIFSKIAPSRCDHNTSFHCVPFEGAEDQDEQGHIYKDQ